MVLQVSRRACCIAAIAIFCFTLNPMTVADAGVFDDIGYTALQTELGFSIPTGTGISVSQIEAEGSPDSGAYKPDPLNAQFVGKTFTLKSGTSDVSSHATTVGKYLYGTTDSMTGGITDINCWLADDWVGSGFLKLGASAAPQTETQKIQNFSWIGNFSSDSSGIAAAEQTLKRFDYMIQRDNVVAVVGQNNGSSNPLPQLMGQSYNSISVGLTNGSHSHGYTTINGTGRIKPDIVVPMIATSWASPIVSSAAALLLDKADDLPALSNAQNSEAVKAILLAGATKDEFSDWDRTTTRPLDEQYGAGELNVQRSYHILTDNGEQDANSFGTVETTGWDFNTTSSDGDYYFFDVLEGQEIIELSAVLSWNCDFDSDNWNANVPNVSLADLNLSLYQADGFSIGTLLDSSISSVDNVEHVFFDSTGCISAGRYALEVVASGSGTDYALAWYSSLSTVPVPEPGVAVTLLTLFGACLFGLALRSQRRLCYSRAAASTEKR